jgi:hypothetical protein
MTSPVEKPHEFGEPSGEEHIELCSRCGLTRRPAPKHPKRPGASYLYRASWGKATMLDLPCTPAMKLLVLARSSAGPEGASAALRGLRIIAEHGLVFEPTTKPLAKLLVGVSVGNASDAHEAARMTASSTLMRPSEADARAFAPVDADDEERPKKRGRGARIATIAREILASRVSVTVHGKGLDEVKRDATGDVADFIGSLQSFKDELLGGRRTKPTKPTRKERT